MLQIAQWAQYAKPVIPVDVSRALVAVWIGINDISDSDMYSFPRNNTSSFAGLYDDIIRMEFKALETVYEAGYRRYLVMNLPPLERTVSAPVCAMVRGGKLIGYSRAMLFRGPRRSRIVPWSRPTML